MQKKYLQNYELDLKIKSIVFPVLQRLEDDFKEKIILEIWENFNNKEIFKEKFLGKRLKFNQEKIEELKKRKKEINANNFFENLTFWEIVRYFRDLKTKYKNIIVKYYNFKKIYIFENWIFSLRFFRNLLCHWETIIFREFEEKLKWNIFYNEKNLKNNWFLSYLLVLDFFNIYLWWDRLLFKEIFIQKNNSPVLDHISKKLEIEGWWVLIKKVYSIFLRSQIKINYFFLDKQIFAENELEILKKIIEKHKNNWKKIVWTNGCFDIMHPGHIDTFTKAKKLWDILVVGLNWKNSPYWKTKPWRPINWEFHRSVMLANLKQVDYIYFFNDETPARPVDILKPDIVLKWWDYYIKNIDLNEEKVKKFNNIVEKELIKKEAEIINITWIYKYFLEENLVEKVENIKWFMKEWLVNVKNGGEVVLVPIVEWCSTTNIVEKILKLKK